MLDANPQQARPSPARHRVVITDFIVDDGLEPEHRILGDLADVVALDAYSEAELVGRIENANAIMLLSQPGADADDHRASQPLQADRALRRGLRQRRSRPGPPAGHRRGQRARLRQRRSGRLGHRPDAGPDPRHPPHEFAAARRRRALAVYCRSCRCTGLRGRVFGVVGLGRIGTATALRAKALGMDVAFYDPYKPCGYDKALGIRRVEDFAESAGPKLRAEPPLPVDRRDVPSIVTRLSIAKMPPGGYLVNTARGAVVDTAAVPEALRTGQLAGAGIDVLEHEPPPADHPLLAAWRDPQHPAHHRADRQSACGVLQRRRSHGHAHEGRRGLPPGPLRPADSEPGELRREICRVRETHHARVNAIDSPTMPSAFHAPCH